MVYSSKRWVTLHAVHARQKYRCEQLKPAGPWALAQSSHTGEHLIGSPEPAPRSPFQAMSIARSQLRHQHLPASALAAIYRATLDREEPAAPPLPPPAAASAARGDPEAQTLREIEPLDASAVFALLHPDGPGYAVVDGVLGQETARRAARAAAAARTQLSARASAAATRGASPTSARTRPRFWMRGASTPIYEVLCHALAETAVLALCRRRLGRQGRRVTFGCNNNLDAARLLPTGRALPAPRGRFVRRRRAAARALRSKPLLTRNRRITAVYYLNENLNREDGGALRIYASTWTPDAQAF